MAQQEIERFFLNNLHADKAMFTFSKVNYQKACVMNESAVVDYFNILWLKEGKARYQIDFQVFEASGETIIFLAPGQIFTVLSEQIMEGYRIAFDSDFYCLDTHHHEIGCNGLLFNDFSSAPYIKINDKESVELIYLIQEIILNMF